MEPDNSKTHISNNVIPSILYVEDEESSIELVSFLVRGLYSLDTAKTGEDALKKVAEKQYGAILMDINLRRGKNGMQVTQIIRTMETYKDTPIIAITAYAMKKEKEDFLAHGMTYYMSKPFTKQELLTMLENVFS